MKESKFWIWFIPLFLIFCFGVYKLMLISTNTQINKQEVVENKDAKTIKENYEKLNDESIKVNLSSSNSYVLASKEQIAKVFESNGIIYFGEYSSYASRKNVTLLNDAISSTSINKIYFINISTIEEDYLNTLKEKLEVKKIDAADIYLIKNNEVINSFKATKYDDDKELSDEQKDNITKEYLEAINELIEKCDESC